MNTKLFFALLGMVILNVILLGLALPWLVSYPDDFLAAVGLITVPVVLWVDYLFIRWFVKKLQ